MQKLNRLIEYVYAAALDATAWPDAVSAIQTHFKAVSAGIYGVMFEAREALPLHLSDIDPDYVRTYVDNFLVDNPWRRVPELQAVGVIRTDRSLDEHYNDSGYYRRTTLFNEWMKPQGFIHSLGTDLAGNGKLRTKLYLYRSRRTGPFSRDDLRDFTVLTRHLLNAVGVAQRLTQAEWLAHESLQIAERLEVGVLLLDENGRILHTNGFAQALCSERDGLRIEGGAVACSGNSARLARSLRRALDITRGRSIEAPWMTTVRRAPGRQPLRVTTIPLSRTRDPFGTRRAAIALIVTDPEAEPVFHIEELQSRYDLTKAEARLACAMLRGRGIREAAELSGLGYQTARSYAKSIFQKTGTSRQAELVHRLLSDRLPLVSSHSPTMPGS